MINQISDMEYTSSELRYKKPITLISALKNQNRIEQKRANYDFELNIDEFVKDVSKSRELANTEVSGYIGKGTSAIVFETPEGKVLKLTRGNHFPMNRPQQSFDVPIYAKGKIGKIYFYLEEKLNQRGLGEGFVQIMRDMIKNSGFKPQDMYDGDIFQIGLSKEGRLYLLDPECAKYKTIFHAIWDKMKRFCKSK